MNDNEELSWAEKNRLHGMAAIPCFVVFIVLAYYFLFYLVSFEIVAATMWNGFIYVILPTLLIGVPSTFLVFEVLHHRKIKQSLNLRAKRFSGRVLLATTALLFFSSVLIATNIFLSPIIGERYAIIISFLTFILGFYAVVTKFKDFFSKLDKGEW